MTELDVSRGLAIIWSLCMLSLPGLIIACILEEIEKHKNKKDKYLIEQRRREFAEDCERAGRKMINEDKIQKLLKENGKKQTIKYTGLFSGPVVKTMEVR